MNSSPSPEPPAQTVSLLRALALSQRIESIHETIVGFFGAKWPEARDPWMAIIRAKAKQEQLSHLGAAMDLAKGAPDSVQTMVILSAAYEISLQPTGPASLSKPA